MGTWGSGNMDSDYAMDTLARWINKIINEIRESFTLDNQRNLYNRKGDSHIIANIDIILSLCRMYHTYPELEINEVNIWEKEYLETFDRIYGEVMNKDELLVTRRDVIEKTFTMLKKLVIELDSYDL